MSELNIQSPATADETIWAAQAEARRLEIEAEAATAAAAPPYEIVMEALREAIEALD